MDPVDRAAALETVRIDGDETERESSPELIAVWSHLGIDVYYCCIECNCREYYGADWCSGNSCFPVRNAACLYLVC